MKSHIVDRTSEKVYSFISCHIDVESSLTLVVATTSEFNIVSRDRQYNAVINLSKINNIRYINKFFEAVNSKLEINGTFVCCFETIQAHKEKSRLGNIPIIRNIYFTFEFIFLRVFPKLWGFKKIYFLITKGRNRLISKAECLGRLVSCGFDIKAVEAFSGITYVVCVKQREPAFNMNVSYGPMFKMFRVGKNEKLIGIYKLRTMHPYAEYLQKYVYETNGTSTGDKADNDFRMTPWGRVLRKLWIDELPQIINLIKGDVKLVGVRPLSVHKFSMYPKSAQKRRTQFKPGIVPPYYADLPKGFNELVNSEMRYIEAYEKNPIQTDIRYFFKAIFNIVFKRKRSA